MNPSSLTPEELERYHRHILLPEVGINGQEMLKQSAVLIVGLGGLGSPAALYLAAAGIGRIGVIDADRVSASNLQRQVIHDSGRIGQLKVDSAKDHMLALNPLIQVDTYAEALSEQNAEDIITQYDLVIDATDNFSSRYRINAACVRQKKPMVYGAVFEFEGQVSVFAPHLGGPCYQCVFQHPPDDPTETIGVFGVIPGTIGTLQAAEALKLLLRVGEPLVGKLLLLDSLHTRFDAIQVMSNPICPICGEKASE
ncbi:MAG: molybdopterin-synthase adenylyltransferase MoeB [Anaerolineaceae bacterium]|nr:molybdopterin-synthase adenylyltransferase MoeB [Anaerolineaceae bacterium]